MRTKTAWHIPAIPPSCWWGSGSPTRALLPTALMSRDPYLDTLFAAGLLCDVCQEYPWTQRAQTCDARICAACADDEPEED